MSLTTVLHKIYPGYRVLGVVSHRTPIRRLIGEILEYEDGTIHWTHWDTGVSGGGEMTISDAVEDMSVVELEFMEN